MKRITRTTSTTKTISLKLPRSLHARLERVASRNEQSKSEIVRAALERQLDSGRLSKTKRPLSALQLAGDLAGCVEGPGDLSTNPKHLEDFGR